MLVHFEFDGGALSMPLGYWMRYLLLNPGHFPPQSITCSRSRSNHSTHKDALSSWKPQRFAKRMVVRKPSIAQM
jgi:hypothetical protein